MNKGSLRIGKTDIRIIIGEPLSPEAEGSVDLAELIRAQIADNLERWQDFGGRG